MVPGGRPRKCDDPESFLVPTGGRKTMISLYLLYTRFKKGFSDDVMHIISVMLHHAIYNIALYSFSSSPSSSIHPFSSSRIEGSPP